MLRHQPPHAKLKDCTGVILSTYKTKPFETASWTVAIDSFYKKKYWTELKSIFYANQKY